MITNETTVLFFKILCIMQFEDIYYITCYLRFCYLHLLLNYGWSPLCSTEYFTAEQTFLIAILIFIFVCFSEQKKQSSIMIFCHQSYFFQIQSNIITCASTLLLNIFIFKNAILLFHIALLFRTTKHNNYLCLYHLYHSCLIFDILYMFIFMFQKARLILNANEITIIKLIVG